MSSLADLFTVLAVSAGAFFFMAGHRWTFALPRCPYSPACADEGRQSRPWFGCARIVAPRRGTAGRAETGQRVAARAFHGRDGFAVDRKSGERR